MLGIKRVKCYRNCQE